MTTLAQLEDAREWRAGEGAELDSQCPGCDKETEGIGEGRYACWDCARIWDADDMAKAQEEREQAARELAVELDAEAMA